MKRKQIHRRSITKKSNKFALKKSNIFKILFCTSIAVVGAATLITKTQGPETTSDELKKTTPNRMNRKILLHYTAHTLKETLCNLQAVLEANKPRYIFLESAGLPIESLAQIDGSLEAYRRTIITSPEYENITQAILALLDQYSRSNSFLVYPAEFYTSPESTEAMRKYKQYEDSNETLNHYIHSGDFSSAMPTEVARSKVLAEHLKFRNNRIFDTVNQILGKNDPTHNSTSLLVVGDGHRNLTELFKRAGYETEITNSLGIVPLSIEMEKQLREWEYNSDQNSLAALQLTINLAGAVYAANNFGDFEEACKLLNRIIPRSSISILYRIYQNHTRGSNVIYTLKSLGYDVPLTIPQYKRKMSDLNLDCK